jgi:hypothetical protein
VPKKKVIKRRGIAIPPTVVAGTLAVLCVLSAGAVAAVHTSRLQGQVSSSGSGSDTDVRDAIDTMEQERAQAAWNERMELAETFFVNLRSETSGLASVRRFFEQNGIRQMEHRRTCALDLRMASKFTKFPVTLRCYRADLQLDSERLRREQEYVAQMIGVREDTRSLALTRLSLLSDAVSAIMTGIDSNVYETVEDLEESKQKLLSDYREPAWLLLTKLRAEQLSTWADALITRAALAEEAAEVDIDQEELLAGIQCLETGRELFAAVGVTKEFQAASSAFLAAVDHLDSCPDVLRNALLPPEETSSSVPAQR